MEEIRACFIESLATDTDTPLLNSEVADFLKANIDNPFEVFSSDDDFIIKLKERYFTLTDRGNTNAIVELKAVNKG